MSSIDAAPLVIASGMVADILMRRWRSLYAVCLAALMMTGTASAETKSLPCGWDERAGMTGSNRAPSVMPTLQNWSGGKGSLILTRRSRILIDDPALKPVATKLSTDLQEISGLRVSVFSKFIPRKGDIALSMTPCVRDSAKSFGDEGGSFYAGQHVELRALTPRGVFYVSRTLLQALMLDGADEGRHRQIIRGYSIDRPVYIERAVMLDVARKFAPKSFLINYIRFLGWYKFNTLHLHLNDFAKDASGKEIAYFRLKSDNQHFQGPLSDDGQYYDKKDWADLEAEAASNGITLVPEFDTPGHSQAFTRARPDLATSTGFLNLTRPETLAYVQSVYNEFLPWFKSSTIHIGGDEVDGFSASQIVPYLNSLVAFLNKKGKTVQAWGDYSYLSTYNSKLSSGLDKSVWIQRWINWNPEASVNFAQSGYRWTDSYGDWYIVPKGPDYFNPKGLSGEAVYDKWFDKPETGLRPFLPIGGQIAVWNDRGASEEYTYEHDIHQLLREAIPAAGQIYWSGHKKSSNNAIVPYAEVAKKLSILGYGPNTGALSGSLVGIAKNAPIK